MISFLVSLFLGGAKQAFADVNCNPDNTVCSGGGSLQSGPGGVNDQSVGGGGGHTTVSDGIITSSGGSGVLSAGIYPAVPFVGGAGGHSTCDAAGETGCDIVGGGGLHTP